MKKNSEVSVFCKKHETEYLSKKLKKFGFDFSVPFDTSLKKDYDVIIVNGTDSELNAIPFLMEKWKSYFKDYKDKPVYTGGILFNTSFYIGLSTAFLIISVLNLIESLLSKIAILLT